MAGRKWQRTEYPGVRFYRHKTRKKGIKYDQYFSIRYQKDGERKEEGCGWASDGWTAKKAALLLAELREAGKTGKGEARLSERRERRRKVKEAEIRDKITFAKFWEESYLPQAEDDKTPESMTAERSYFKRWLSPELGAMPLKKISPLHLEKVKAAMKKDDKSPRSAEYCLAVARQVFNEAKRCGVFQGENPANQVKSPKADNRRLRFLTYEEADALLAKLVETDRTAWELSLISLHCGLRAGEIFKLRWSDIDTGRELIAIKDSKSGRSRFAHMTKAVKTMLESKVAGDHGALLYPAPGGAMRREVPRSIKESIDALGFNEGRADRRDKAVFHSLRHTFASWLVQAGVDLYRVKELMGHSVMAMTERYAHLAPKNTRQAVKIFENILKHPGQSEVEADEKAAG